jgi:hypothetical protein
MAGSCLALANTLEWHGRTKNAVTKLIDEHRHPDGGNGLIQREWSEENTVYQDIWAAQEQGRHHDGTVAEPGHDECPGAHARHHCLFRYQNGPDQIQNHDKLANLRDDFQH